MRLPRWYLVLFTVMLVSWLAVPASQVAAQDAPPSEAQGTPEGSEGRAATALRVFLDCQRAFCDQEFIRQEVHWIDWVRDRLDAQVQVLVTSQPTGGGGDRYELDFIGLEQFQELEDRLQFATAGDATRDEERRLLIRYLTLGLARYVARTPTADQVVVGVPRADGPGGAPGGRRPQVADPGDDPWNFWVFTVGLNTFLNGESRYKSANYNGSLSASRTTEAWKFSLRGSYSQNTNEFDLGEGQTITTEVDSWSVSSLLVKSLGEHWGIGGRARVGANTFVNQDLFWRVEPGIEYNVFPYSQSARRQFTFQYTLPLNGWDYTEETLYGQTEEVRLQHELTARLELRQPWGQAQISISGSQYFHDPDFYNVGLFGSLEFRLFRGFNVNLFGSYDWVRDQLYLEAGDASTEDILTRQRALATSYNYFTSFGISYRFGSIFNNIVNPRFGR